MTVLEPQHADVMAALRDLMQHQAFTDFTIQLKEGSVFVSRIVTAALSPVFRNMLTTDMAETRTNKAAMDHITKETWTCIEEFYFGCQKLVTIDNVVDVLEASHMYELDKLTQYCCDYLQSVCSSENCLAVKRIASKLSLKSVAKKASEVVAENFSAVCKSADFLCLEKSELLELLEKEELVTTEDDMCKALLAWMEAKDADSDTCTELFCHVRLEKVSDDFIGHGVMYHSVSMRTPAIQVKVRQEVTKRMNRCGRGLVLGVPQRRRVRDADGSLVVVGGRSQKQTSMYHWSSFEGKWISLPIPVGEFGNWFSSAAYEGTIFITGGNKRPGTDTHLFDVNSRTWSAGPALLQGRARHGMAVVRDKVYVVAGYWNKTLNSVEEFNMTTRQWTRAGNLTIATYECGVTAIGDTILVAGGDTDESQSLIQTFNVETRTAAVLNVPLPRPMRHVQAASLGNTAFFVGREGDLVQVTDVEGEFQMTSHIQLKEFENKHWFGLHVTDTRIRVMGGGKSQFVVCWNHQGQKLENDEVGDLPKKMDVYGVPEVDCSSPRK